MDPLGETLEPAKNEADFDTLRNVRYWMRLFKTVSEAKAKKLLNTI